MESHRIFRIPTKSPFRSGTSITPLSAFFACSVNCMPSQCGFIRFPQNFPTARVLTALRAIYAKAALRSQAARLSLPEYFLFPCEDTVPCHFRSREPATDAHPAFFARPSFSRNSACAHRRRNHTSLKQTAEPHLRRDRILPQRFYMENTRRRCCFITCERIRICPVHRTPKPQRPGIALPIEFTRSAVSSGFRPQNPFDPAAHFSTPDHLRGGLPLHSPGAFSAKNNAHEFLHAHSGRQKTIVF